MRIEYTKPGIRKFRIPYIPKLEPWFHHEVIELQKWYDGFETYFIGYSEKLNVVVVRQLDNL
jgi:hypothetical protein